MSSTSENAPSRSGNFAHPTATLLADFACGRLDEAESVQVETHLDDCPSCCRSLAKLSQQPDRFVEELVSAATPGGMASSSTAGGAEEQAQSPSSGNSMGRPARTIGRFVVRHEIGQGGFGVVLLAYDPRLRREVAIKIPRLGSFLTQELRERFLRESQAAAALDHPHIVPIHESGEADGVCYIISSYCRGSNLAAWLKQRSQPVDFATAARVVVDLADAVEHAHARGVLHRDLKPSNVLLETPAPPRSLADVQTLPPKASRDEILHPRITDFGLAKLDGEGPDSTRSNVVMGTVGYMSPEQARGRTREITAATDIYSLGAILYELLAGRPPFVGESDLETLQRVQDEEPIPPARLRTKLPRDLETICLKCLQKNPRRRYESTRELADDLRRFLDGQPILARPTGRVERLVRWCRRKPALAAASACIVILLAALVAGSVLSSIWLREEQRQTLAQLKETIRAEDLAEKAGKRAVREELAAKRELFASLVSEARARRLAGRSGQKFDSLQALDQATDLARMLELGEDERLRLRNEVIACLPLMDVRIDRAWPAYPAGSSRTGIAFDADIQRYAMVDANGRVVVRRIEDNVELWSAPINPPQSRPAYWWLFLRFSPDGNYLAARGQYVAGNPQYVIPTRVWDLRSGEQAIEPLKPTRNNDVFDFDFSPDSRTLAAARPDGSVGVVDLVSGAVRTLVPAGQPPRMIHFDPSGRRLAVCQERATQVVQTDTGRVVVALSEPAQVVAWSSRGNKVATANGHAATIWDSHSGARLSSFTGHESEVVSLGFLPQSDTVVTTSWVDTRLWNAVDGRQLLLVDGGNATRFSRDRHWLGLGFSGAHAGRFEVALPDGFRTLGKRVSRHHLEISPDGRLLMAVDLGRLLFWDAPSGQFIGIVPLPKSGDRLQASFDQTGANLLTTSPAGVHRWPIRWKARQPGELPGAGDPPDPSKLTAELAIGPPQPVPLTPPMAINGLQRGRDGRFLLADNYEVRVVDVSREASETVQRVRHAGWWMAASGDGKWLATSQWHGYDTRLWDLRTGRRVHTIVGTNAVTAFRPDSRYLVVGNPGGYEFYEVGTWRRTQTIETVDMGVGRPVSFSRDGRLIAVSTTHSEVNLLDGTSFEQLATFVAPSMERLESIHLGPRGKRLVVKTASGVIHIWELDRVRDKLASMGLDWQSPPELDDASAIAAPPWLNRASKFLLRVESGELDAVEQSDTPLAAAPSQGGLLRQRGEALVNSGRWQEAIAALDEAARQQADDWDLSATLMLRGVAHYKLGNYVDALADGERAYDLDPEHYLRSLALAWALATCPEVGLRDVDRAVTLARRSTELYRHSGAAWYTLGMAYFRQGRLDEAAAALDEAMQLRNGGDAYDWFLLSMIRARQSNLDEARHWCEKAEQWMQASANNDVELMRLHSEAQETLWQRIR